MNGIKPALDFRIPSSLLKHFGLSELGFYWSKSCDAFKVEIQEAILERQMLAVIGEFGTGKSVLIDIAIEDLGHKVQMICSHSKDKENMKIGSILNDTIDQISSESMKRNSEAKAKQFTRLVGSNLFNEGKTISIRIEEAHRLHPILFRSLKELREERFNGQANLFSVILIGHNLLREKLLRMKEAYYRSWIIELNEENGWMNQTERVNYLQAVFKGAITATVRDRIAARFRLPLEMNFFAYQKMVEARNLGKNKIDDEVVPPSLRDLFDSIKRSHPEEFSYGVIADYIKSEKNQYIGKTTVHEIITTDGTKGSKKNNIVVERAMREINNDLSKLKVDERTQKVG